MWYIYFNRFRLWVYIFTGLSIFRHSQHETNVICCILCCTFSTVTTCNLNNIVPLIYRLKCIFRQSRHETNTFYVILYVVWSCTFRHSRHVNKTIKVRNSLYFLFILLSTNVHKMKLKILNRHECPEMKPKKNKIEMHEQIYFTLKTLKL